MFRNDYIMRLIERFGEFLQRLTGMIKDERFDEADDELDSWVVEVVGMDPKVIANTPADNLVALFSVGSAFDVVKAFGVAQFLKHKAEVLRARGGGDEFTAIRHIGTATRLFISCRLEGDASDFMATCDAHITDAMPTLLEYEIPTYLKAALIPYYEATGAYATSDNLIFQLHDEAPGDATELGTAFYERLLLKADQQLKDGDLPREEVEESLAELRSPISPRS